MGLKSLILAIFAIFAILLLVFYWIIPFGELEFNLTEPKNFNFTLSGDSSMQFYENMRYPEKRISYKISDCSLQKEDDMERSLAILQERTILEFYPVESEEEISVTCSDENKFSGNLFVAGEGGVTNVTQTNLFHVIRHGKVLLLRKSSCPEPNIGLHELLHALGFDHSENKNNLMYPTSNCKQVIGTDMLELINEIYSIPSLPDLSFEDVDAKMRGKFLDTVISVRNHGLQGAPNSKLIIYANEGVVKEVEVDALNVGYGVKMNFTNVWVPKINIEQLRFVLENNFEELSKENNELVFGLSE